VGGVKASHFLIFIMATTIRDMLERFQSVNITDIATNIVNENQEAVVEYNNKQLLDGVDANNDKLSPQYRQADYAELKNQMNPLPGLGVPDLLYTGTWAAANKLSASNGIIQYTNTDEKDQKLQKKYGADIHGLTEESKAEVYNTIIHNPLVETICEITGATMGQ